MECLLELTGPALGRQITQQATGLYGPPLAGHRISVWLGRSRPGRQARTCDTTPGPPDMLSPRWPRTSWSQTRRLDTSLAEENYVRRAGHTASRPHRSTLSGGHLPACTLCATVPWQALHLHMSRRLMILSTPTNPSTHTGSVRLTVHVSRGGTSDAASPQWRTFVRTFCRRTTTAAGRPGWSISHVTCRVSTVAYRTYRNRLGSACVAAWGAVLVRPGPTPTRLLDNIYNNINISRGTFLIIIRQINNPLDLATKFSLDVLPQISTVFQLMIDPIQNVANEICFISSWSN